MTALFEDTPEIRSHPYYSDWCFAETPAPVSMAPNERYPRSALGGPGPSVPDEATQAGPAHAPNPLPGPALAPDPPAGPRPLADPYPPDDPARLHQATVETEAEIEEVMPPEQEQRPQRRARRARGDERRRATSRHESRHALANRAESQHVPLNHRQESTHRRRDDVTRADSHYNTTFVERLDDRGILEISGRVQREPELPAFLHEPDPRDKRPVRRSQRSSGE